MGTQTLSDTSPTAATYVLGHAPGELERLERQADLMRPITRRTLQRAGITPGMCVLDLGTGTGDVTRLAAELVGSTGSVVGIDRSEDALALASAITASRGFRNVAFVAGDLHSTPLDGPFDAVVGRFVLMHLPDAACALRHVATLLRPGGILAFVEPILLDPTPAIGETPLMARTVDLICTAFRLAGRDLTFGLRLPNLLKPMGTTAPGFISEGIVVSADSPSHYEWPVATLRSLLPVLERAGRSAGDELGLDTLAARLAAEAIAVGSMAMPLVVCGSWARIAA